MSDDMTIEAARTTLERDLAEGNACDERSVRRLLAAVGGEVSEPLFLRSPTEQFMATLPAAPTHVLVAELVKRGELRTWAEEIELQPGMERNADYVASRVRAAARNAGVGIVERGFAQREEGESLMHGGAKTIILRLTALRPHPAVIK